MSDSVMNLTLSSFTDVLAEEIADSQPISLSSSTESQPTTINIETNYGSINRRPSKHTGQYGNFRSVDEIDAKYRSVFTYPFFNLVQSSVIEDALYSDRSMVVCAPTGSGKTVVFEMAIVQLLLELEDKNYTDDFKIIYMAPVKAICTERLTEWYPKFTKLGLLCIEVTGDTDVDFSQLKPYRIIITTPEKWDILTRRWTDYRGLAGVIKLFLIDEVHILNDETRGPVLEAVVSRMKTIESSSQSAFRIEQLQKQYRSEDMDSRAPPRIRFVAVSATVSNPEDVAAWLSNSEKMAVYHKFGDECRPVKIKRIVEGYHCGEGTSIFKFDIILNYKLWPIIQKYYDGKPTLIFCNTRKSVAMTAETLSRELTINFNAEQKAKLNALAASIKNKKLQALVLNGVGCHHAGLLFEERVNIEQAFRQRDLPILITTTTLAMGVNLPAHLVIIKNTQQYVNGAYQEYSISTVLQMVGRAGRPQFDTEATAVIMTRLQDKHRYQALVGGSEPLQSYLHKRLPENLNSEAALHTVTDVAQCVQWLRSTFLYIRAAKDPRRYLALPSTAAPHQISNKIEELCVKAMNGLATSGLITMDEASCIESTEAGRLMSIYYLDFETMKKIMKIEGTETLEQLLCIVCDCHELSDMHLRVDERRCLNALNRNNAAATIRFPMKGKISTRQMKLNCVIQAILGCLPIPDPSLNQESLKIMRIADRVCKCLVKYETRPDLIVSQPQHYSAVLNVITLAKCIAAHLWENSPYVSKQLRGIGPMISNLLATAGKVNFMLLEEAHPRDLERIMNKGPPAGNVLRKQASLLPKYKLTMSPIDEITVSIELTLLNQSYLAENMESLTAGEGHQSYVVVGDSENHILLLASFKDKNLITVFDGIITHTVTRKHRFEHKIFAHCISTTFVGIDVQADYLFKDLDPLLTETTRKAAETINETPKRKLSKQTNITDTFRERKRKNPADISQSKEKQKRNNTLIEKLKTLKESFGRTTKEIQDDLIKSAETSSILLNEISHNGKTRTSNNCLDDDADFDSNVDFESDYLKNSNSETFRADENTNVSEDNGHIIDDSRIDSLLEDIENEISKTAQNPKACRASLLKAKVSMHHPARPKEIKSYSTKPAKKSDNFSFIDLLEKNVDFSDDESMVEQPKESGFSDAIKSQIQQYLQKAKTTTKDSDILDVGLLQSPEIQKPIKTFDSNITINERNETPIAQTTQNVDYLHDNQERLGEQLTQNILEDDGIIDINTHTDVIEIRDNIFERATEKTESCEHVQQKNKKHNIKIQDVIKRHDETKKANNIHDLVDKKITTEQNNVLIKDDYFELDKKQEHTVDKSVTTTTNVTVMLGEENLDIADKEIQEKPNSHENSNDLNSLVLHVTTPEDSIMVPYYSRVPSIDTNSKNEIRSKENIETGPTLKSIRNLESHGPIKCMTSVSLMTRAEAVDENNLLPLEYSGSIKQDLPINTSSLDPVRTKLDVSHLLPHRLTDETRTAYLFGEKLNETLHSIAQTPNLSTNSARNQILDFGQFVQSCSPPAKYSTDSYNKIINSTTRRHVNNPTQKNNVENSNCMRKYSYTATEIDVWSEKSNKRTLQVIKKLKFDVDITEIVSEEWSRTKNIEEAQISNVSPDKHSSIRFHDEDLHNTTAVTQKNCIRKRIDIKPENSIKTKTENLKESVIQKTYKNCATQDSPRQEEKFTECIHNMTKGDEEKPQDVKKSAVDGILQKYANVLRKKTESFQPTSQLISTSRGVPEKMKTKRPFKISDIHKVEATLPEGLIIERGPDMTSLLSTPPYKNHRPETRTDLHNDIYKRNQSKSVERSTGLQSLIIDTTHFDNNLTVIEEPDLPKSDTQYNYNIDHSMLDPRMLLQCFTNKQEEELPVIPPPLEFCDNKLYSPPQEDTNIRHSFEELNNKYHDKDSVVNLPSPLDKSSSEASKEIETWIFDEDNYTSAAVTNPFNIIKKTPVFSHNPSYNMNSDATRKVRLGQFKFNTKQKFNVHRK